MPVLLVLDNVTRPVKAAVLPFLELHPAPGSRLLATTWQPVIFKELSRAPLDRRAGANPVFHEQLLAGAMLLQHEDACQLICQDFQASRDPDHDALADGQLADMAATVAQQLASKTAPAYVPKVLSVVACMLGQEPRAASILPRSQRMLDQLHSGRQPTARFDVFKPGEDAIFRQLAVCFRQLTDSAQQIFLDIHMAAQLPSFQTGCLNQLALWLSCRHVDLVSMEDMKDEVCDASLSSAQQCCCAQQHLHSSWN